MRVFGVELGLKNAGFKSGLDGARAAADQFASQVGKSFSNLKSSLTGIGGAILGAFSFDKAIDKAVDIQREARRFGESAEEVQKLGAAAKRVGSDMEEASKGGFKAFVEAQKALSGDEGAQKKFEALGITMEQLAKAKGPADMILLLADAVKGAANQHEALANAADVVGVKQAGLLQLFKLGGDEIRKIGNEAVIMGNNTVKALEKASKTLARFKNIATTAAGGVLGFGMDLIEKSAKGWGTLFGGGDFRNSRKSDEDWMIDEKQRTVMALREKSRRHGGMDDQAAIDHQASVLQAEVDALREKKKLKEGGEEAAAAAEAAEAETAKEKAEAEKEQNELDKLREQLAAKQLDNDREQLSLQEKATSQFREWLKLKEEARDLGKETKEGLQKEIEAEHTASELARTRKQIEEQRKHASEEAARAREKEAEAEKRSAEKEAARQDKLKDARERARDDISAAREHLDESREHARVEKSGKELDHMVELERMSPSDRAAARRRERFEKRTEARAEKKFVNKFGPQFARARGEELQRIKDSRNPEVQAERAFKKALENADKKLESIEKCVSEISKTGGGIG